ncbi:Iron(3+)-hydroxamate import system permease protein FhuB [Methylobacterium crusticola]|uniref:Iron(3+)-hydroxamate import system permease protein FhuB n=1 Tax=Methylobacterium crusticola TaxID=1697972 RepID=A0ABQ4R6W4_9HYPH|nr:Fe(3+)-hydroxamate ABC transporter permease FhuB [Methylobacterium crusticola]GJD53457.1 Iron(3+)-hydroxamate import system permease protein FhuB [Methylobacterium crusticola]
MAEAVLAPGRVAARPRGTLILIAALALPALLLSLHGLTAQLPLAQALRALAAPDPADIRQVILRESWLPRLVSAWLAGAALALAGAVFQQVLRNPLASPATLGVSAGAELALAAATVFAPGLLAAGREPVALAGSALAAALVFGLTWRRGFAPLALILTGLLVNLYCGAFETLLVVLHQDALFGIFLWGAGSLAMNDWTAPAYLAPRLAACGIGVALLARPLALLDLGEAAARSLGLPLGAIRAGALALAVALGGFVVAGVGVIGFVGLAAPVLAGLTGARRLPERLWLAPLLGAVLLWLTDGVAAALGPVAAVPTGALASLVGVPVLLWLLPRLARHPAPPPPPAAPLRRARRPGALVAGCALALAFALPVACLFGPGPAGWHWAGLDGPSTPLPWRLPRVGVSLAAGALLALAGTVIQRLTANPLASPEALGISAGAALGVLVLSLALGEPGRAALLAGAGLGAAGTLAAMLALGRRSGHRPDQMLLAGVALTGGFGAVLTLLMISGDPSIALLRGWLAGSTARAAPGDALAALGVLCLAALALPALVRWLDILPLGDVPARSLGVDLGRGRLALMALAALLTAAGTLAAGPLTFVGLIAPHLARLLGLARAAHHLAGAALIGALVMVAADWAARTAFFPYGLPAGLVATVVGGPALLWLLARR